MLPSILCSCTKPAILTCLAPHSELCHPFLLNPLGLTLLGSMQGVWRARCEQSPSPAGKAHVSVTSSRQFHPLCVGTRPTPLRVPEFFEALFALAELALTSNGSSEVDVALNRLAQSMESVTFRVFFP